MPCCGQPAAGYARVWHLRSVPGDSQPREFPDQASALAEQRRIGGKGVLVQVTKKIG